MQIMCSPRKEGFHPIVEIFLQSEYPRSVAILRSPIMILHYIAVGSGVGHTVLLWWGVLNCTPPPTHEFGRNGIKICSIERTSIPICPPDFSIFLWPCSNDDKPFLFFVYRFLLLEIETKCGKQEKNE